MKRRVRVEFDVEVPVEDVTDQHVEWLRYTLGDNGQLAGGNPMMDLEAAPVFGTFRIRRAAAPWDRLL